MNTSDNAKIELTAAARSICPGAAPGGLTPPPGRGGPAVETGLGAVGTGGLPGFGFAATGGGAGLGFVATAGGLGANELPGRELAGVLSADASVAAAVFFHGVADPFAGIIPGKTDTGLAWTSAAKDFTGVGDGFVVAPDEGGVGCGRRAGGGGGGGVAALFGGTSSR